ncbi:hypothetical protein BCF46_0978 [Litoreibacter meonggei]|uniref:Uncharacterized protein n=1 Tax=Litoreibacter meonggei TaxID=1049199 RepID=A0A497WQE9_9RHOB|nr:hypothetical protein [Litoreibacter meonggei]RLJ58840.1 hypothetical protein BCF46_0978 [Litoreibacter meonggei]
MGIIPPRLRPRGHLVIAPKHLGILALPAFVLLASEYLLGNFGNSALVLPDTVSVDPAPLLELTARYRFLSAWFFYFAVCVIFIAVFFAELWSQHSPKSAVRILLGLVAVVAFTMVFNTLEPEWMGSFEAYELLGKSLFVDALSPGQLRACETSLACDDEGAFHGMEFLLDKANHITSLAAAAVIAGMVLALARPHRPYLLSNKGLAAEAEILRRAQDASTRYLYCSGILLSVGMVLVLSWMKWPGQMIADPELRARHAELVNAISLYRGVSYSVLILSYYMPVSLILMVRIERFHSAVAAHGNPSIGAEVMGFDINKIASLEAFKKIVAIVSPILASALGAAVTFEGIGG